MQCRMWTLTGLQPANTPPPKNPPVSDWEEDSSFPSGPNSFEVEIT